MFVCRIWLTWLRTTFNSSSSRSRTTTQSKISIDTFFITRPAYLSVELNAHNLLYLILLVKQKHLPKQALINFTSFNSQACESIFRDARSLSGSFSTMVNFTVNDFIRRARKLSILNRLKHDRAEENLSFPVHHKHRHDDSFLSSAQIDEVDTLDVQQLISDAYEQALDIIRASDMLDGLNQSSIITLEDLSKFIFNDLSRSSKMFNRASRTRNNDKEDSGSDVDTESDEDHEDYDSADDEQDDISDEISPDDVGSDEDENEEAWTSTKSEFHGIKIVDSINPTLKQSYFKIKINEKTKYLHKQSACWLLSKKASKLSSDRLSRVMQQSKITDR